MKLERRDLTVYAIDDDGRPSVLFHLDRHSNVIATMNCDRVLELADLGVGPQDHLRLRALIESPRLVVDDLSDVETQPGDCLPGAMGNPIDR